MSRFFVDEWPDPPYYAVIFSSEKKRIEPEYQEIAEKMLELVKSMPGFLGYDSYSNGMKSLTISYWRDLESIDHWKHQPDHQKAQDRGNTEWYKSYTIQITRVESRTSYEALF